MKRLISCLTLATVGLLPQLAEAGKPRWQPSRARLLIHGTFPVHDEVTLGFNFIPAPNLLGELSPLAFFGPTFQVADWLKVTPYLGWDFAGNQPIAEISFNPKLGDFYAFTLTDFRVVNQFGYWFAQVDYITPYKWLHVGAEGEGWGFWTQNHSWSQGVGPNVLFRWGKYFGCDVAMHWRWVQNQSGPELFARFHIFL